MNSLMEKKSFFSKEAVNTKRQEEYDYLRGLFMVFIFLIHAFQATLTEPDLCVKIMFGFATMSGAAMFMFVMGMGSAYSKSATAGHLAKSGVRMVAYQYLNNVLYVVSLAIPYPFVARMLSGQEAENFRFLVSVYIQYINIFFMTGIIYLLLALYKKCKVPVAGYAVTGIAFAALAPVIGGRPVDIPVIGYIVKLFIGHDLFTSFTPLYFVSYVFLGVVFGKVLRRVADKTAFYKIVGFISGILVAGTWIGLFVVYGFTPKLYTVLTQSYSRPGFLHVPASIAHILFFAALFYFAKNYLKKENLICRQILYYSIHISKYYALHIIPYFVALGFHKYLPFAGWQCWLLALSSMLITEGIVRGYNKILEKRK